MRIGLVMLFKERNGAKRIYHLDRVDYVRRWVKEKSDFEHERGQYGRLHT